MRYLALCAIAFAFLAACASCEREPSPAPTPVPQPPAASKLPDAPAPTPVAPAEPVREQLPLPSAHYLGRETSLGGFTVQAINRYWVSASEVVTLEQAADRCEILETGRRDEVVIKVAGRRPVLAMLGDLLHGGRADRIVARSVVLEPGTNLVPVFTASTWKWPPSDQPAEKQLKGAGAQVDLNVKAATLTEAPSRVTAAVQHTLEALDLRGEPVAYADVFSTNRAAAADALFARGRQITWAFTVGFVVRDRERVVAADLFDSSVLCEHASEKLLRSYALAAIANELTEPESPEVETPLVADDAPRRRAMLNEEDLVRLECRRTPDTRPIHTAIFRK